MPRPRLAASVRPLAAGGLAIALACAPAAAQEPPRPDPLCWRGRPLPRCRAFLLFEVGYHAGALGTRTTAPVSPPAGGAVAGSRRDVETQVAWAAGAMRNRDGGRTALGGTVLLGEASGEGGTLLAAQARVRRWLGPAASAEVAAGPLRFDAPAIRDPGVATVRSRERVWGLAVDGRLTYADRVGLGVRAVAFPRDGRPRAGVLAGGNVGSGLAVATTVAVAAVVALAVAALSSDY